MHSSQIQTANILDRLINTVDRHKWSNGTNVAYRSTYSGQNMTDIAQAHVIWTDTNTVHAHTQRERHMVNNHLYIWTWDTNTLGKVDTHQMKDTKCLYT